MTDNLDKNERRKEEQEEKYKIGPQLLAGFAANLAMLTAGVTFAWPTVALPKLRNEESHLFLTSSEGAWVASAMFMGACVGPIISGFFVNFIGRKRYLCLVALPFLFSWSFIYLVGSFQWLFVVRFVSGLGVGGTYTTVPIYLGEIAQNKIRGALGAMAATFVSIGSLMTYSIGPWISSEFLTFVGLIPSLLFLLIMIWMPETPYYHLKMNRQADAEKSLSWLRGTSQVSEELREMTLLIESDRSNRGRIIELISIATNRRATFIMWIILSAQQLCGITALMAYLGLLFERTSLDIQPGIAVIITGLVSCVVNLFTSCVVDKLGRKPLLLLSTCGTSICLCMIATYFHMEDYGLDNSWLNWLPMFAVISFYIFFAMGLGPIPYAILAEIYPTSVKAWATMVVSIYGAVLGTIVMKVYQMVADEWGHAAIFYGFAGCEWTLAFLMLIFLPETKGKSLKDIQEILSRVVGKSAQIVDQKVIK